MSLWNGPCEEGITFSLLSRFLLCRERFRLLVVDGLAPIPAFNHRIEYGNMWHACEEAFSAGDDWSSLLKLYGVSLCNTYPQSQEQIVHWYRVCIKQFSIYVEHHRKEHDELKRVAEEEVFKVPYKLSNGSVVYLKGKWDGVFEVDDEYWLMEHKTKVDVNELAIEQQLSFDLQTMIYYTALTTWSSLKGMDIKRAKPMLTTLKAKLSKKKLAGVLYNVVRRPLSGGKGSIKQKKDESTLDFYDRVGAYIEDDPKHYFIRKWVRINDGDLKLFKETTLDPVLTSLITWWKFISSDEVKKYGPFYNNGGNGIHWRHPFGVHNSLNEGGHTDLDENLRTGSRTGLCKINNLFPELSM